MNHLITILISIVCIYVGILFIKFGGIFEIMGILLIIIGFISVLRDVVYIITSPLAGQLWKDLLEMKTYERIKLIFSIVIMSAMLVWFIVYRMVPWIASI